MRNVVKCVKPVLKYSAPTSESKKDTLYLVLCVISCGLLPAFCCDSDFSGVFSTEPILLDIYFIFCHLSVGLTICLLNVTKKESYIFRRQFHLIT